MANLKEHRLLVIAPHPDDEILGCGGLINRIKRAGGEVFVLFLTVGTTQDFSESGVSTQEDRMKEVEKVMEYMNIDGWRMVFPGNKYHLRLDNMAKKDLIDEIERGKDISIQATQPTAIATPYANDYNQDHRAACKAVVTATRPTPNPLKSKPTHIFQYELPSTTWTDRTSASVQNFFVHMDDEDLEAKTHAMDLYKSQIKHPEAPISNYGITTLAQMRGLQCGCKYAEAYFAKRIIV